MTIDWTKPIEAVNGDIIYQAKLLHTTFENGYIVLITSLDSTTEMIVQSNCTGKIGTRLLYFTSFSSNFYNLTIRNTPKIIKRTFKVAMFLRMYHNVENVAQEPFPIIKENNDFLVPTEHYKQVGPVKEIELEYDENQI